MSQKPRISREHGRSRGAALLLAAFTLVAGLAFQLGRLTVDAWAHLRAPGPALPDQALGLVAGSAGTAVAIWLLSALAASTLAVLGRASRLAVPATCAARRIAPATVRNAVATLLGVALVAAPTVAHAASASTPSITRVSAGGPAHPELLFTPATTPTRPGFSGSQAPASTLPRAELAYSSAVSGSQATIMALPGHASASLPSRASVAGVSSLRADTPTPAGREELLQRLSPGWTPDRPRPTAATSSAPNGKIEMVAPTARRASAANDERRKHVVVRQGDTLWSIASRHLGPGATDSEIAHEWPRWYRVNRHLIGADPHRLLPGERLRSPDSITSASQSKESGR
ncbi:LysM peptidoglycan-binding domain-containing protein [Kineosporia babensis]|uniref:LysM peptidoglycan-binding domain-containing protein n=1 Tax=Kineosporia babensis TaxID=499548 RepID=A0A9X1NKK9_9ACTN|nr:LysM peptidoglycan-binding domain-containing protein [Kineosporia babensis]MCD5315421.1 LysM peptidoglycan-binding domain-containing protein [Kineosporia babensis]